MSNNLSPAAPKTSSQLVQRVKGALKPWLLPPHVPLFWSKTPNWGDALSPWLIEQISGKPARFESAPFVEKFLAIGSIIHLADKWATIWGSGMISPGHLPPQAPQRILAVRGPLTRDRLLHSGLNCPEVYGDPALLLPRYLDIPRTSEHPVGIIPHQTDRDHPWIEKCRRVGHLIIDVEAGIEEFVRQVCSCEAILSSSLHGLICADSYGVPSRRIILGGKLIGGDFKFADYYSSIHFQGESALVPGNGEDVVPLSSVCTMKTIDLDLNLLQQACRF